MTDVSPYPSSDPESGPASAPRARAAGRRTRLLVLGFAAFLAGIALGWFVPLFPWERPAPEPASVTRPGGAVRSAMDDLLPGADAPLPPTSQVLIDEAKRLVEHLQRTFPATADALEIKARLHAWLGESDEAVRAWEQCLKLDPNYAYALVGLADTAAKKADFPRAEVLARQALDAAPDGFQARAILANALIQQRRSTEAVAVLDDFLKADPRSQGHYLLGQAYYETGQYENALEHFEEAVRRYPDYAEAYHGLSRSLSRLGRSAEAQQAMAKYREFSTSDKAARRLRGMAASDEATTRIEAASLYSDTGRIYFVRGKMAEAERVWRRAAVLDPNNVACRQSMAWLCRQTGRIREAAIWLEQIAAFAVRPATYWVEIGRLREELLEFQGAEQAYRTACQADPEATDGPAALAGLFLSTGQNLPEALELARTVAERRPSGESYTMLAAAYRCNGNRSEALAASEKAVALAPGDPAVVQFFEALKAEPKSDAPGGGGSTP